MFWSKKKSDNKVINIVQNNEEGNKTRTIVIGKDITIAEYIDAVKSLLTPEGLQHAVDVFEMNGVKDASEQIRQIILLHYMQLTADTLDKPKDLNNEIVKPSKGFLS